MATILSNITVTPNLSSRGTGGFNLHWTVTGQNFNPTFRVMVADDESGPWTEVAGSPTQNPYVMGVGRKQLNFELRQTFRIMVLNGPTLVTTSPSVQFNQQLNRRDYLFYREHLRRLRLTLERRSGATPGKLLIRRHFGVQCPVCCDEILKTPVSSECTTCYGTGIVGGYYAPAPMWGDWAGDSPINANTVKDASGPSQVFKNRIKTFPFPDAHTEDIWVDDSTGYRYLIQKQDLPHFKGVPMFQLLDISRLPATHPVYGFPL